jgi:hypothetical protein
LGCPSTPASSVGPTETREAPPPPPPPLLLGHPARQPQIELCIVPRHTEVINNEVALERVLVASVAGTQLFASTSDVDAYLSGRFGVATGSFITYPFHPEDFLVVFTDSSEMLWILHEPVRDAPPAYHLPALEEGGWAMLEPTHFTIRVTITGVLPHLWLRTTAQDILGSSYRVISLAPETGAKANLKTFYVLAGSVHPDLIPVAKDMLAPIEPVGVAGSGGPSMPCLRYRASIDIFAIVDA